MSYRSTTTILALLVYASLLMVAGGDEAGAMPDFTQGGTIPEKAKHDWNLGATGLRGLMFIDKLETTQARQISVTQVAPKSLANGSSWWNAFLTILLADYKIL